MDAIETWEHNGCTVKVYYDECSDSPREFDNLGKLALFGRRLRHLSECDGRTPGEWLSGMLDDMWREKRSWPVKVKVNGKFATYDDFDYDLRNDDDACMAEAWRLLRDYVVAYPLYVYEHSGIAIRLQPFYDPWDSWQDGYYYAKTADLRREYGRLTAEAKGRAQRCLAAEVDTFSAYCNGEVYGYVVEGPDGTEDSCWGYYGWQDVRDAANEAAGGLSASTLTESDVASSLEYGALVSSKVAATLPA